MSAPARELYDQLWAPLSERLVGKRNIYVAPDGFLHVLPFAALVDPAGHYLVESHDITILASGRDLVVPPAAGQGAASEIFSAPAYHFPDAKPRGKGGRTRGTNLRDIRFVPLPGTAREAERIAALFGERATHHSGVDALEAAVRAVGHPRVLHLATHGFFLELSGATPRKREQTRGLVLGTKGELAAAPVRLEVSPNPLLRAGLAFAGANQGVRGKKLSDGSDGVLTALEVLDIDLVGTDLVVLSACDTGVGQWQYGSGVAGLRSAFQEAGARAVLSTLWPIDDAATAAFMEQYYGAFLTGAGPQAALRRVQRAMLEDQRWRHPFFWAPFVVSGRDP